ncbi:hypothetical protein FQZ97_427910 [compost metagenome]
MPLHVLGHVEAHQLDAQRLGQLPRHFGLADPGGTGEEEGADRLVRRLQPGPGQLDRGGQRFDGIALAEHGELEVALEIAQQLLVRRGDVLRRNARDLRHDVLDLGHLDALHALLFRLQALVGAGLVDHVDGLVRHVAVVDVAGRQLRRRAQGFVAVLDAVMLLEARLEALEDADGVFHGWLDHVDLLEAPRQGAVLLEDAAEFLEGRRADAADLAGRQQRLEQVGSIHHPTGGRTGTDDGVDLVDEQHRVRALAQFVEQRLEALLEVAAVFGAGQQRAEVQRVDHAVGQQVGHLAIDDALGQAFGDGRLADARLADQQRVVLAPTGKDLRHPFDFRLAPDQRIDPPLPRQFVQIAGIGIQRMAGGRGFTTLFILHVLLAVLMLGMTGHLGDAMGDVVDHIYTGDALLLEQEHRLAFLFAEDRHQHIGAGHLALAGTLHMEHRTLQDALEAQRRLGFAILVVLGNQRRGGVDEFLQVPPQLVQVRPASPQHGRRGLVVQERQQQMLDGHEFMPLGPRLLEGEIEGDFELSIQHDFTSLPNFCVNRLSLFHTTMDAGSPLHID